jgi:hypothetical protein
MPDLQPVAIPGFQIVHGDQLRSAHMDVVRWSLGHRDRPGWKGVDRNGSSQFSFWRGTVQTISCILASPQTVTPLHAAARLQPILLAPAPVLVCVENSNLEFCFGVPPL